MGPLGFKRGGEDRAPARQSYGVRAKRCPSEVVRFSNRMAWLVWRGCSVHRAVI